MSSQPLIKSTVVTGSGVEIVHRNLEASLENYQLNKLNPWLGSIPFLVPKDNLNAEIVHTTPELGANPFSRNGKNIVTFHNFYYDNEYLNSVKDLKRRLYYKHVALPANKSSAHKADRIVAVSQFLANLVKRELKPKADIQLIYNGVDTNRFSPDERRHEKIRILFAGNPIARKGFQTIIDLADAFSKQADFIVTGGLQSHKVLERENIIALPRIDYSEMQTVYQGADILLFPSTREGFGLVVAEAMSCGLPVICSNSSALPELIQDSKGGFLVEQEDRNGWIKSLSTLISSEKARTEFGGYNRETAIKKFDLESMIAQYRELFSDV